MPSRATMLRAAIVCCSALVSAGCHAESFDTEHIFAFMIGADIGDLGEREFQSETTGRFSRTGGRYRAVGQELELEFVPFNNFRVELGGTFALHDVNGIAGLDDRRQFSWQGLSLDLRYRFLDRRTAPFGLTFAVESRSDRVDESSGARISNFGTEFTLALERELVPDFVIAALNFSYGPEWSRTFSTGVAEREATAGVALGLMVKAGPDLLLGGEARYLRKYDGIGLDQLEGQALFVGPVAYFQLSERARLTAAWSVQAWGQSAGSGAALDLVHFERHQARLVFGVNF